MTTVVLLHAFPLDSAMYDPVRGPHGEVCDLVTPDFPGFAARKVLGFAPGVADLRVLRSWAGVSSETPDMQAVLGRALPVFEPTSRQQPVWRDVALVLSDGR